VDPQVVSAIADSVVAITSIALVVIAASQLPLLVSQLKAQGNQMRIEYERERKWATVKACDRYSDDPIIFAVARRIWDVSQQGTDYTDLGKIDRFDIAVLLNYLEGMAVGVTQGIYIEDIIKDHFMPVIDKAVRVFLKGESGASWKAKEALLPKEAFPRLLTMHTKWFPQQTDSPIADQGPTAK
jgi:hypothetical protein